MNKLKSRKFLLTVTFSIAVLVLVGSFSIYQGIKAGGESAHTNIEYVENYNEAEPKMSVAPPQESYGSVEAIGGICSGDEPTTQLCNVNVYELQIQTDLTVDDDLTVSDDLIVSGDSDTTGTATFTKMVFTLVEVTASTTPSSTQVGTGIPIPKGSINVQVISQTASVSDYVNLPEITATGTEIYIHTPATGFKLNTASTTGGILETINDGSAGAMASSTIDATPDYVYCRSTNLINWGCTDYTNGLASTTPPSA